jgi:hypothetical protein
MNDTDSPLGTQYKQRRLQADLSGDRLAKLSRVGRTRLSFFETGKIVLKPRELAAIDDVFLSIFEWRRRQAEAEIGVLTKAG